MTYRVVVTENARANLRQYFERAAEAAPQTAIRWLDRFYAALQTLSERPERCPLASENDAVDEIVRQFNFGRRIGTYRVLFTIENNEVRVLHIRRAAMGDAGPKELHG